MFCVLEFNFLNNLILPLYMVKSTVNYALFLEATTIAPQAPIITTARAAIGATSPVFGDVAAVSAAGAAVVAAVVASSATPSF
jgi:hypothetical protein